MDSGVCSIARGGHIDSALIAIVHNYAHDGSGVTLIQGLRQEIFPSGMVPREPSTPLLWQ
jgi:hypothetical protein